MEAPILVCSHCGRKAPALEISPGAYSARCAAHPPGQVTKTRKKTTAKKSRKSRAAEPAGSE